MGILKIIFCLVLVLLLKEDTDQNGENRARTLDLTQLVLLALLQALMLSVARSQVMHVMGGKYQQMLSYGIMMLVGFFVYVFLARGKSLGTAARNSGMDQLYLVDVPLSLCIISLAIVKLCLG